MHIEESIKELEEYINLDKVYQSYKNGERVGLSDFEIFCMRHCTAIETLITEYNRLKVENEYIHKELDKQQLIINNYAKELDSQKEINEEHQKENKLLRKTLETIRIYKGNTMSADTDIVVMSKNDFNRNIEQDYISKEKIKEEIKEINKIKVEIEEKINNEVNSEDVCYEYVRDLKRQIGLCKRDIYVLQGLLEGGK